MPTKIKWRRYAPGIIDTVTNGLVAVVYVIQFGTFTSTKRYSWRVERGNQVLGVGTEYTQRKAKEEAERYLTGAAQ